MERKGEAPHRKCWMVGIIACILSTYKSRHVQCSYCLAFQMRTELEGKLRDWSSCEEWPEAKSQLQLSFFLKSGGGKRKQWKQPTTFALFPVWISHLQDGCQPSWRRTPWFPYWDWLKQTPQRNVIVGKGFESLDNLWEMSVPESPSLQSITGVSTLVMPLFAAWRALSGGSKITNIMCRLLMKATGTFRLARTSLIIWIWKTRGPMQQYQDWAPWKSEGRWLDTMGAKAYELSLEYVGDQLSPSSLYHLQRPSSRSSICKTYQSFSLWVPPK